MRVGGARERGERTRFFSFLCGFESRDDEVNKKGAALEKIKKTKMDCCTLSLAFPGPCSFFFILFSRRPRACSTSVSLREEKRSGERRVRTVSNGQRKLFPRRSFEVDRLLLRRHPLLTTVQKKNSPHGAARLVGAPRSNRSPAAVAVSHPRAGLEAEQTRAAQEGNPSELFVE